MEELLKTYNLTKEYKKQKAVDSISLSVNKGDIYGFIGQNGAGKTTFIRMVMGLIKPTSGYVEMFGNQIKKGDNRQYERVSSIIEFPGFYGNLTAFENLDIHRRLMGIPDKKCIEKPLEAVGMLEERNKKVKEFSLGMKQRLGIARALLYQPELLILDEPTNGLDPVGIKEIRQLILRLAQNVNITIFISSHLLSEVQQLATKIGIIHQGKLIDEINKEMLITKARKCIQIKLNEEKKAVFILEQQLNIFEYKVIEAGKIQVYERLDESTNINRVLIENGVEIKESTIISDTLEDYFIKLTGGAFNV